MVVLDAQRVVLDQPHLAQRQPVRDAVAHAVGERRQQAVAAGDQLRAQRRCRGASTRRDGEGELDTAGAAADHAHRERA